MTPGGLYMTDTIPSRYIRNNNNHTEHTIIGEMIALRVVYTYNRVQVRPWELFQKSIRQC